MAKIDSALAYYLANYASNETSRYDSHKKSDLRRVTNRIVKSNKESPLYKISNADEAKHFAIDIKENAKDLQNVVASLSDSYGSFEDSFQKKVAFSSKEENISVKYVGDGSEDNPTENFEIHVDALASPQINTGFFLKNDDSYFKTGNYSFDLTTTSSAYEFQFNLTDNDTNKEVLEKLEGLFNNSSLGVKAEIISNEDGTKSALQITSRQTGLSDEEDSLFSISPAANSASIGVMDTIGINQVSQPATNSSFTLNGQRHSSLSNTFTINNAFELTLHTVNEPDESTIIGFKTNVDAVADNITTLTDSYNKMIDTALFYSGSEASEGNKLLNDMRALSLNRQASLESIGIIADIEGRLSIDKEILADALTPTSKEDTLSMLKDFKDLIGSKADNIAINPMNYVNKVVVAYKNPGHNFNTPYISSIYSGMMIDNHA